LSSILRALKKIQNETSASAGIQAGPGMSSSARVRENAFLYKSIIAVAILMGVAFGGAWVIKTAPKDHQEVPKPVQETPEINVPPQPGLVLRNPTTENPAWIPIIHEPKEEIPLAHSPTAELTDQPVMHDDDATNHGDLSKPADDHRFEDVQKPDTNATARLISPDKKTIEQDISSTYHEIDESAGMDLQAISWAADPQKRLAVINGTLCRENESVKGYTIKRINPDDVIVSNGSITGRLVLKIR
jgi:hypothetical protein